MTWDLQEALDYYQKQGAPGNQTALVQLLKEMQQENALSMQNVSAAAAAYAVKESFLLAVIKRIPSLHLADTHCLEICCGPNCPKRARLADFVEKTYGKNPHFTMKRAGCMRMCGKGPNIRWDGVLYNAADEALLRRLIEQNT